MSSSTSKPRWTPPYPVYYLLDDGTQITGSATSSSRMKYPDYNPMIGAALLGGRTIVAQFIDGIQCPDPPAVFSASDPECTRVLVCEDGTEQPFASRDRSGSGIGRMLPGKKGKLTKIVAIYIDGVRHPDSLDSVAEPPSQDAPQSERTRSLIPVCCAAEMSTKAKDKFLRVNMNDSEEQLPFVFVDDLNRTYTAADALGGNSASSTTSAFAGQDPQQCYRLLQALVERTDSDIDSSLFVIYDERSQEDDTVVLVEGPEDEDEEAQSVRAETKIAYQRLMLYLVGDAEIEEDRDEADQRDGVLRED